MGRATKLSAHRGHQQLPGDILNVSRIEYETAVSEIDTNRRRFERNEQRLTALEREIAVLKKLVQTLHPSR